MDNKRFTLYPEVPMPDALTLTWDSLVALGRVDSTVRTFMILVERGEMTREQALVAMVFGFYDRARRHYEHAVELLNTRPFAPVVLPRDVGIGGGE